MGGGGGDAPRSAVSVGSDVALHELACERGPAHERRTPFAPRPPSLLHQPLQPRQCVHLRCGRTAGGQHPIACQVDPARERIGVHCALCVQYEYKLLQEQFERGHAVGQRGFNQGRVSGVRGG